MDSNRITELSGKVAENSKIVTDYLVARNLPAPSFDADGRTGLAISPADKGAFAARSNLIAATKELHDPVLGPKESLRHLAWDVNMKSSILPSRTSTNQALYRLTYLRSVDNLSSMLYTTSKSPKPFPSKAISAVLTWQRESTLTP
jgi:hypothetical protein